MPHRRARRALAAPALLLGAVLFGPPAEAADTPDPATVTVAGSFQQALGCPGDWQPDCDVTLLTYDPSDEVWQGTFEIPAGTWEYKVALDGSWSENYGANATRDGANLVLTLTAPTTVKFYYSHATHWVADSSRDLVAVAPGSFQSELGCPGDWQPDCLRSWLQDPNGDGRFSFRTRGLPAGDYEVKVALNESWDVNYGEGGVQNGPNIPFSVPESCADTEFAFDGATKVLTIGAAPPASQPSRVVVPGSFQDELGCSGDWQPDCDATALAFDATDDVWQGTFEIPAGSWEYKAALDGSWDENYGANATRNGANLALALDAAAPVKFYFDRATNWITSDRNARIVTAPGSFQSELGCPGDWQPDCLRSWLEDPDGDGVYTRTVVLPAGTYETKAAIDESWDENYGEGGVQNGPNIAFTVPSDCAEVFFSFDGATNVLTVSAAGAPRGDLRQQKAHWLARDVVAWRLAGPPEQARVRLHYDPIAGLELGTDGVTGGESVPLAYDPAGVPAELAARYPHLADLPVFRVAQEDLARVPAILRDQIAVSATAEDGTPVDATGLQIPGVLDDLFFYDGPLGPAYATDGVTLRLWAPTAQSVLVHLFAGPDPAAASTVLEMAEDPATGVWSAALGPAVDRAYYLYEVRVFAPTTGRIETNLVTDPYSVSLSADSARSQIVDLADPALEPEGWSELAKPPLAAPEDIAIYELHVRDFGIRDASVPEADRGTFRAFAHPDSDGMRHLGALAESGLTHVHLLPTFDFATVPERREDRLEPAGDLASFPPDSEAQQAAIWEVRQRDGFNWGYDPWHYSAPEGGYATNPDGAVRIREFREMVAGLNRAGLRAVMDVVYNHTTASGESDKSVLDRVVPGYYHRLNDSGAVEHSTCCENTASEHLMMEKLLIDSVRMWATAYKVDGFRFDLMGHHMKSNMTKLRAVLDALTSEDDGVDGRAIWVYGEGWNFGEVANDARGVNATQLNMAGTGIGTFNDRLRDAVRGGSPFSAITDQGFATGLATDPNGTDQGDALAKLLYQSDWIRAGIAGGLADYRFESAGGAVVKSAEIDYNGQPTGYTRDPQESINYVSAHDNETLFDAVQLKAPRALPLAERERLQVLGLATVALAQGVPFFHAGADILRSKSMDRDSYDSGDWFNAIDWTYATTNWGHGLPVADKNRSNWAIMAPLLADPALAPPAGDLAAVHERFRELLRIRKSTGLFRLRTAEDVESRLAFHNTGPGQIPGVIAFTVADDDGRVDRRLLRVAVVLNGRPDGVELADGELEMFPYRLHAVLCGSADPIVRQAHRTPSGALAVPARTAAVFVAPRPAAARIDLLIGDVAALEADGTLNRGQANALTSKLENARRQLLAGRATPAANVLEAFANQVRALVAAGILPEAVGDALVAEALDVAAAVSDEVARARVSPRPSREGRSR